VEVWRPKAELVNETDRLMQAWSQGDTVRGPVVWLADRDNPFTKPTSDLGAIGIGATIVNQDLIVVVTQTCDIRKPSYGGRDPWPFVQVAPVVELSGPIRNEAAAGHSARFAPLPGLGKDKFADLNICSTMEKVVLAHLGNPIPGCHDDNDKAEFANAVARSKSRFAFPDGFDVAIKPLRERFRDKRNGSGAESILIGQVKEIRARKPKEKSWYSVPLEIELVFIIDPDTLPPIEGDEYGVSEKISQLNNYHANDKIEKIAKYLQSTGEPSERSFLWHLLVECWYKKCTVDNQGRVRIVGAFPESASEYPIFRSWLEPKLDLDNLSRN
jgi:hypothetical protein